MNKNAIITIIVIILIAGGYYFYNKNKSVTVTNPPAVTTPSPAPSPTPNPTPVPIPAAPTVETSSNTSVSSSTAWLSGQIKPNGAATSYWFEYGETTALGTRGKTQAIGSGYSFIPTPAYVVGLKANTLYYYRLSAINRFATVNGTMYSFTTNNTPPVPGLAPTTHTTSATNVTRDTANINGTVNPNGSATSYWFEYGIETSFGATTAIQSAGSGNITSNISVSLSNLMPQRKYYFRLNAQNQYGTINGAIMSFTTQGPPASAAPTVVTQKASNITTTTAVLNGQINPNGYTTNYWFEYGDNPLLVTLLGSTTQKQTTNAGFLTMSVKDNLPGLNNSTNYYYRLVGRNSLGTNYGSIIQFKTK